jgi:hypothetical protein
VLENVPAAGLRAALEAVPEPDALRTVLIKSCPELQSLSFLENFPARNGCMCAAAGGGRAVG